MTVLSGSAVADILRAIGRKQVRPRCFCIAKQELPTRSRFFQCRSRREFKKLRKRGTPATPVVMVWQRSGALPAPARRRGRKSRKEFLALAEELE